MSNNDPPIKCVCCGAEFYSFDGWYGHCATCWESKPRSERRRIEREASRAFDAMVKRLEKQS